MIGYQFGTLSRAIDPVPYSNFLGSLRLSFHVLKNTDFGINWTYYSNNLEQFDASYTRQAFTLSLNHRF